MEAWEAQNNTSKANNLQQWTQIWNVGGLFLVFGCGEGLWQNSLGLHRRYLNMICVKMIAVFMSLFQNPIAKVKPNSTPAWHIQWHLPKLSIITPLLHFDTWTLFFFSYTTPDSNSHLFQAFEIFRNISNLKKFFSKSLAFNLSISIVYQCTHCLLKSSKFKNVLCRALHQDRPQRMILLTQGRI